MSNPLPWVPWEFWTWIENVAVVFGLVSVYLSAKERIAGWPTAMGYVRMRFITLPPGRVVPRYRRSLNALLSMTTTEPTDVTDGRTRLTTSGTGAAGCAARNRATTVALAARRACASDAPSIEPRMAVARRQYMALCTRGEVSLEQALDRLEYGDGGRGRLGP